MTAGLVHTNDHNKEDFSSEALGDWDRLGWLNTSTLAFNLGVMEGRPAYNDRSTHPEILGAERISDHVQANPVCVSLIAARTNVAPIKSVSISCLELRGALLVSNLAKHVQDILSFSLDDVYL